MKAEINLTEPKKIVAKVVNAGKEYITGDTVITALKATTVSLTAGELMFIICLLKLGCRDKVAKAIKKLEKVV